MVAFSHGLFVFVSNGFGQKQPTVHAIMGLLFKTRLSFLKNAWFLRLNLINGSVVMASLRILTKGTLPHNLRLLIIYLQFFN